MNNKSSSDGPRPEKVLVQETGVGRYQVQADAAGIRFLIDEPVSLGGLGSGHTPYDLLAAALASCTSMTLRLYADQKGWPLDHISVRVGHVRGSLTARDRFERELMFEGTLDEAQRARLLQLADRCPVHITLERGADVRTELRRPVIDEGAGLNHDLHMTHMAQCCGEIEAAAS